MALSARALLGGGFKSVQRGLVDSATVSTGTTPETAYIDIPISSVDLNKATVNALVFFASDASSDSLALDFARSALPTSTAVQPAKAYLLNQTTLRIYTRNGSAHRAFSGRWEVIESN